MGERHVLYGQLLAVTRQYLSEVSVRASIDTVLAKRGLQPEQLDAGILPEVVADAMVGLRLFCAPEKVGDLMMDLAELCERVAHPVTEPAERV